MTKEGVCHSCPILMVLYSIITQCYKFDLEINIVRYNRSIKF